MKNDSHDFLRKLLDCATPSGHECSGQKVVKEYLKKHSQGCPVVSDVQGNVYGVFEKPGGNRVLLDGHCDEVGLIVVDVDKSGFLYVEMIGGIYISLLKGERVIIHTDKGKVHGVIGNEPIHMAETYNSPNGKIKDIWVDIGCKSKKQALKYVSIGDPITIDAGWIDLCDGRIACRGLDNRIGSFVVSEVWRRVDKPNLDCEFYCLSSTFEEVSGCGVKTAAKKIEPDVGIAVDLGFASDSPDGEDRMKGTISLGKGPILSRGPGLNEKLHKSIVKVAKENRIKFQVDATGDISKTNAGALQASSEHCAAALISVPSRYMHTPVEVIQLSDVEATIELLTKFVESFEDSFDFDPLK